jgi:hypothetical protein
LAPFLFVWVAEASLRWRAERLRELERRQADLHAMQSDFPHLDYRLTISTFSDDIISCEEKAIERRDIFASAWEWDPQKPGLNDEFEQSEGPIVQFLQRLATEIGPNAEFGNWNPLGGPDYAVCQEEAAALVGGDMDLAREIIGGNVQLHKMPAELRKRDRLADRIVWVRQEADAARREADELLGDLDLGI